MTYVLRRILAAIPTLLLVLVITFSLGFYGPGDPIVSQLGEGEVLDPVAAAQLRHQYGLDRPFLVQLWDYTVNLVHGDMGKSLSTQKGQEVSLLIARSITPSLQIGGAAALLVALIGIPLGVIAALRKNTWVDYAVVAFSAILPTVPTFVLAPLLLILFVLKLGWIRYSFGWNGLFDSRAILPVMLMVVAPLLIVVRQSRTGILAALSQDFVRTARAKGLAERVVIFKHVMRVAMGPVLTSMGLILGSLLTGSLFVESIFGIPGFGRLVYDAFRMRDYPLILGTTMVVALLFVAINLLTDLMYRVLNPRVRLD